MLDQSKLPSNLVVTSVWVPDDAAHARRPVAQVSEPRRQIAGAVLIALGVILGLAVLLIGGPSWPAFGSLLIAWTGVAYASGGRSGFYEVDTDGGLGGYLGRARPDVSSMRPRKPTG